MVVLNNDRAFKSIKGQKLGEKHISVLPPHKKPFRHRYGFIWYIFVTRNGLPALTVTQRVTSTQSVAILSSKYQIEALP